MFVYRVLESLAAQSDGGVTTSVHVEDQAWLHISQFSRGVYFTNYPSPRGGRRNMIFSSFGKKTWHLKEEKPSNFIFFKKEEGENIEFKPLTAVLVNRNSKVHCMAQYNLFYNHLFYHHLFYPSYVLHIICSTHRVYISFGLHSYLKRQKINQQANLSSECY